MEQCLLPGRWGRPSVTADACTEPPVGLEFLPSQAFHAIILHAITLAARPVAALAASTSRCRSSADCAVGGRGEGGQF